MYKTEYDAITTTITTTTTRQNPAALQRCAVGNLNANVIAACDTVGDHIQTVDSAAIVSTGSSGCTQLPNPLLVTKDLTSWANGCCTHEQICIITCAEKSCQCQTGNRTSIDFDPLPPGPKQVVLSVSCEATTTMTTTTTTTATATTTTTTTERACLKGQFLAKATNNCTACPDGQYQNLDGHTNRGCMPHHPCNATNMHRIFGDTTDKKFPSICIELGAHKDCPTRDVDGSNASYWHPGNISEFIDQVNARTPWHVQTQNETVSADMSKAVTAIFANLTGPDLPWGGNVTNDAIQAAFLTEYNASITLPAQLEKAAVPFYALMCIEATPPCGSDNDLVYESAALTTTSDRVCDYCRPIIPTDANATNDGTNTFDELFASTDDLDACPLADRTFAANGTDGFLQECTLPSMVEGTGAADGAPPKNNRCCRVTETGPLIFNDTAEKFEFLSNADNRVITLTSAYRPEYQNGVAQCKHRAGNFHYESTTTTTTATTTTITATTKTTTTKTATTKTATTTTTTSTTTPVSHALRNRKIGYWVIGGLMLVVVAALLLGVCDRCHAATAEVSADALAFGAWGRKRV